VPGACLSALCQAAERISSLIKREFAPRWADFRFVLSTGILSMPDEA